MDGLVVRAAGRQPVGSGTFPAVNQALIRPTRALPGTEAAAAALSFSASILVLTTVGAIGSA